MVEGIHADGGFLDLHGVLKGIDSNPVFHSPKSIDLPTLIVVAAHEKSATLYSFAKCPSVRNARCASLHTYYVKLLVWAHICEFYFAH